MVSRRSALPTLPLEAGSFSKPLSKVTVLIDKKPCSFAGPKNISPVKVNAPERSARLMREQPRCPAPFRANQDVVWHPPMYEFKNTSTSSEPHGRLTSDSQLRERHQDGFQSALPFGSPPVTSLRGHTVQYNWNMLADSVESGVGYGAFFQCVRPAMRCSP